MRFKGPISSEGQAAEQMEAPAEGQGLWSLPPSMGLLLEPPRARLEAPEIIEYPGPSDEWRRDPRLRRGETAAMMGWVPCDCNGFCRPHCPGRSRHPSYQGTTHGGCPNPATSAISRKGRCVACLCKVRCCQEACDSNRSGSCGQHFRETQAAVLKRPAAQS